MKKKIVFDGIEYESMAFLARRHGCDPNLFAARVLYGWSIEKSLKAPPDRRFEKKSHLDPETGEKICSKCGQKKPSVNFYKSNGTKDGLHSWCRGCCSEGNVRSRDKLNSTIEGRAKTFLFNAKKSAKKRGHEFNLNAEDIVLYWNQQGGFCAYSGRAMTLEPKKLNTVSIERINSKIGYIPDNTILVCRAINTMKSDFELEDFFYFCRDVSNFIGVNGQISVGAFK